MAIEQLNAHVLTVTKIIDHGIRGLFTRRQLSMGTMGWADVTLVEMR